MGSTPIPSAIQASVVFNGSTRVFQTHGAGSIPAGCSICSRDVSGSMARCQRVRSSSNLDGCTISSQPRLISREPNRGYCPVRGSRNDLCIRDDHFPLVQWTERRPAKAEVTGSTPVRGASCAGRLIGLSPWVVSPVDVGSNPTRHPIWALRPTRGVAHSSYLQKCVCGSSQEIRHSYAYKVNWQTSWLLPRVSRFES